MLLKAIFEGLALGFGLSLSIGPAFFTLIQTSTKRGFKPALALAFGIFLSDLFYVILAYLGVAQFLDAPKYRTYIGLVGGTVLAMFGFFMILQSKSVKTNTTHVEIKAVKTPFFILKGFLLNLLNPIVIGLWMACVISVNSNSQYSKIDVALFFASSLLTIFLTDILKAYSANKITAYLSDKVLRLVNIVAGIILMLSGLVLIYKVFV